MSAIEQTSYVPEPATGKPNPARSIKNSQKSAEVLQCEVRNLSCLAHFTLKYGSPSSSSMEGRKDSPTQSKPRDSKTRLSVKRSPNHSQFRLILRLWLTLLHISGIRRLIQRPSRPQIPSLGHLIRTLDFIIHSSICSIGRSSRLDLRRQSDYYSLMMRVRHLHFLLPLRFQLLLGTFNRSRTSNLPRSSSSSHSFSTIIATRIARSRRVRSRETCALSAECWTGSSTTSSWRGESCEEAETWVKKRTRKPWRNCRRVVMKKKEAEEEEEEEEEEGGIQIRALNGTPWMKNQNGGGFHRMGLFL
ncbi:uncharacterized protein G2W53_001866 [Senna tora]|uniref:Uncharacterized protein n=1 Tax=Senna tora TaxID=362788 RepID=A0A835CIY2_9FABA|nr:uncharacterized protein G2W53_001866 [Senna tora]